MRNTTEIGGAGMNLETNLTPELELNKKIMTKLITSIYVCI